MTRIAALDISQSRARYVVIDRTLRRSEVVAHDTVAREEEEERADFYQRVQATLPPNIDSLITSADANAFSTRLINFPFGDMKKVEQTLDFELEQQIPYDLDEIVSTSHVTSKSKSSTTMLTAVTPRERLGERIADFAAAGLEPRAIVLPGGALSELRATKSVEPVAIVALGNTESHLCIIDAASGLRFARTMRAGGHSIDRAIASAFKLDLQEARLIKEEEGRLMGPNEVGGEEETQLSEALVRGAGPVISALATTFRSLPPELAPTEILLTGGLSRLPGLTDHISSRLGIEVSLLDLGEALAGIDTKQPVGPEFAVALGMAMAIIRRGGSVPLNLRRGPFAYSGDIQLYRGEILRVGIGIGVVMILAIIGSIVRYSMITAVESEIQGAICKATEKIVGREICDPTAAIATLRATPGVEDGVVIPEYSAANLYEMISKALGSDIDVSFSQIDFRIKSGAGEPDAITGKGEAASFEATEQIIVALKKDPCVQEAKVDKQKKTSKGRVEFNLLVDVRCPPGMMPGAELGPVADISPVPKKTTPTTAEAPPGSGPPRPAELQRPDGPPRPGVNQRPGVPPRRINPPRPGSPQPKTRGIRPPLAPGMPAPPGISPPRPIDKSRPPEERGQIGDGSPGRPMPPAMMPRGVPGPRVPKAQPTRRPPPPIQRRTARPEPEEEN